MTNFFLSAVDVYVTSLTAILFDCFSSSNRRFAPEKHNASCNLPSAVCNTSVLKFIVSRLFLFRGNKLCTYPINGTFGLLVGDQPSKPLASLPGHDAIPTSLLLLPGCVTFAAKAAFPPLHPALEDLLRLNFVERFLLIILLNSPLDKLSHPLSFFRRRASLLTTPSHVIQLLHQPIIILRWGRTVRRWIAWDGRQRHGRRLGMSAVSCHGLPVVQNSQLTQTNIRETCYKKSTPNGPSLLATASLVTVRE